MSALPVDPKVGDLQDGHDEGSEGQDHREDTKDCVLGEGSGLGPPRGGIVGGLVRVGGVVFPGDNPDIKHRNYHRETGG